MVVKYAVGAGEGTGAGTCGGRVFPTPGPRNSVSARILHPGEGRPPLSQRFRSTARIHFQRLAWRMATPMSCPPRSSTQTDPTQRPGRARVKNAAAGGTGGVVQPARGGRRVTSGLARILAQRCRGVRRAGTRPPAASLRRGARDRGDARGRGGRGAGRVSARLPCAQPVPPGQPFGAWLHRIVANAALDATRSAPGPRCRLPERESRRGLARPAESSDLRTRLHAGLAAHGAPARGHRTARCAGFRHGEISRTCQHSGGTARSDLFRASCPAALAAHSTRFGNRHDWRRSERTGAASRPIAVPPRRGRRPPPSGPSPDPPAARGGLRVARRSALLE